MGFNSGFKGLTVIIIIIIMELTHVLLKLLTDELSASRKGLHSMVCVGGGFPITQNTPFEKQFEHRKYLTQDRSGCRGTEILAPWRMILYGGDSYLWNSNKLTNQMQQFYKFIT